MSYTQKRGQNTAWRNSLMRNLATDLIKHGQLTITLTRANELKKHVDWLITLAKDGSLHARRQAISYLYNVEAKKDQKVINKLFDEIGPKYKERNGGYTRVIKAANRRGDNALMAIIELV